MPLLLLLGACSATDALPTRATLLEGGVPANIDPRTGLPVTWTPAPTASSEAGGSISLAATLTPSPTGILPTRTPVTPTPTNTPIPTDTPDATPTPLLAGRYFSFIPTRVPSGQLGPSKLGIHVIRNNDPGIMTFVRDARPSVIKAVDDLGFLAEVKQVSPWTVTVGRFDDLSVQNYGGSPETKAREYVDRQLSRYRANPAVDYWEGWNEPDPNLDNMGWYARFEAERVRYMAAQGLRTAVGGFATGVPELDEFRLFLPAIEAAQRFGGILTLHEYGAPDLTFGYGGALPGQPSYGDRGSLKFRYRWFYRDILEPLGLVIPLVITEAGVDGIIGNRPGPSGLGWRDFEGYWVDQGWGHDGPSAFINQLAWYDAGVRRDGYVIGFTVFTAGGYGQWQSYNINAILPQLSAYVNSQR